MGTGFIVRRDGMVVTAAHVIQDASRIRVKFADGRTARVQSIIAEDTDQDFAVLKIEGDGYATVPLGDSDRLRQGERILALGNPLGLDFTATDGIVSALRDTARAAIRPGGSPVYIQISAPISRGNSGGPIFNGKGEAVGVAVFKYKDGENLNFALAINRVKPILNRPATGTPLPPAAHPPSGRPNPGATTPAPATGGSESWFLIASKTTDDEQVYRFVDGDNPLAAKEWLQAKWAEGYSITDIAEGTNRWVILMSQGTGYGVQSVLTDAEFPEKRIKERWGEGYVITNALYGDNRWLFVLSKTRTFTPQSYMLSEQFPDEWIRKQAAQGYRVTLVNGDGKRWLVVMNKNTSFSDQVSRLSDEMPRDWIREKWDAGYSITSVGTSGGKLVFVMSKGGPFREQGFYTGRSFPSDWIKEKWNSGYNITGIR
jgi:hypothetical protein